MGSTGCAGCAGCTSFEEEINDCIDMGVTPTWEPCRWESFEEDVEEDGEDDAEEEIKDCIDTGVIEAADLFFWMSARASVLVANSARELVEVMALRGSGSSSIFCGVSFFFFRWNPLNKDFPLESFLRSDQRKSGVSRELPFSDLFSSFPLKTINFGFSQMEKLCRPNPGGAQNSS
jgi:hypothetical protein